MNGIVRKARKSKVSAGDEHFDLIGRRESLNVIEDVGGLVLSQHSALSIQPANRSVSTLRIREASIRLTSMTALFNGI